MEDNNVAIIWSSQGVQQGDPMSSFLFCIVLGPLLQTIEDRLKVVDNRTQVLAILYDIKINIVIRWAKYAFYVATEHLHSIDIRHTYSGKQ